MWIPLFDAIRFNELLRFSPQQAFEYRLMANGTLIPELYGDAKLDTSANTKEEVAVVQPTETPEVTPEVTPEIVEEKTSLDSADLRKLLTDNNIKFSNASTIEKLMEKCIENNLL